MIDYYEILGIGATASEADIKESYRRLVHLSHPDKGGTAALFRLVHEAYEVLSNPAARRAYDGERGGPPDSRGPKVGDQTRQGRERQERDRARREGEHQARAKRDDEKRAQDERERAQQEREARERAERELILQPLANDLYQLLLQRRRELQLRRAALFPKDNPMSQPLLDLPGRRDSSTTQLDLFGCFGAALVALAGLLTVGVLVAALLR